MRVEEKIKQIAIIILYLERKNPRCVKEVLDHLGSKLGKAVIEEMRQLKKVSATDIETALNEMKEVFSLEEFSAGNNLIKKLSSELQFEENEEEEINEDLRLFSSIKEKEVEEIKELFKHEPKEVFESCVSYLRGDEIAIVLNKLETKEGVALTKGLMKAVRPNRELMEGLERYIDKQGGKAGKEKEETEEKKGLSKKEEMMIKKLSASYEGLTGSKQQELLGSIDKGISKEIEKRVLSIETFVRFEKEVREAILAEVDEIELLVKAISNLSETDKGSIEESLSPRKREIYKEKASIEAEADKQVGDDEEKAAERDVEKAEAEKRLVEIIREEARKQGISIGELIEKVREGDS
mgnify:CR=1 FL=1